MATCLNEPSIEQLNIINKINDSHNILVDAVAGSGKTTLVLNIAKLYPNKKILQLTYNNLLAKEVNQKAINNNINNIDIYTYHSIGLKYYLESGYTDVELAKIITNNMVLKFKLPSYDIIVIDETQDMTMLYFSLVKKIIKDLNNKIILIILGDRFQGLYEFKGADSRFLTLANNIWNNYNFINMPLQTSYRVTNQIATFVNEVMLGYNRLIAIKDGYPVEYVYTNTFASKGLYYIFNEIKKMIIKKEITENDIFVLAGSVKSTKTPIKKLENIFVEKGFECYCPLSDESKIDDDIIKNKIVFSTFHQAKGRERPVVIIFGFDESYFKYNGKDYDPYKCPSTLYVGTTRAASRLFLLHHETDNPLPFLKKNLDEIENLPYVNFYGTIKSTKIKLKELDNNNNNDEHSTSPTELVKYIKQEMLLPLQCMIDSIFTCIKKSEGSIDIPCKVKTENGNYEMVSHLNGIVIPTIYESKFHKVTSIQKHVDNFIRNQKKNKESFITKYIKEYNDKLEINDYLHLANLYISILDRTLYNLSQTTNYDWLTNEHVDECHKFMEKYCSNNLEYEVKLETDKNEIYYYKLNDVIYNKFGNIYGYIAINAIIDAIDEDIIWEFKCVQELQIEHFLQLVVYAWIYKNTRETNTKRFLLMNILTKEIHELNVNSYLLDDIIKILFDNKFNNNVYEEDSIFIENCKKENLVSKTKPSIKKMFIIDD